MGFGLYKPGQGYWVRVLTAVMAGVLVLAGAAWVWGQLKLVRPPVAAWKYTVTGLTEQNAAALSPGAAVELLAPDERSNALYVVGSGVLASVERVGASAGVVSVRGVTLPRDVDPLVVRQVRAASIELAASDPAAVPLINLVYIQTAGVGAILLLGAFVIYWLVGVREKSSEFLILTDGEMKKVNWSTWKDIRGSTLVVITVSILLAACLFAIDQAFALFFRLIGVLEQ